MWEPIPRLSTVDKKLIQLLLKTGYRTYNHKVLYDFTSETTEM